MSIKVAVIGGGGVRTPLLIYGLAQAPLEIEEVALYDVDAVRAGMIAALGSQLARFRITVAPCLEEAVDGATFVLSSIRVGGVRARARDERIAIEHGLAGQETTGPGGLSMALRTIPVSLAQARVMEKLAPSAWLINFTNPAGLISQALTTSTGLRVIGICDTPAELFHRIAEVLGESAADVQCEYGGLNHLGWVRRVLIRGDDVTARLLDDEGALRRLYPAGLFDPGLIRILRLIPTEYLFFYYSGRKVHENQVRAGASRGEEIERMNAQLFAELQAGPANALETYRRYLARRNASYMRLEGQGTSAFEMPPDDADPFEAATGYHRIALEVMVALASEQPRTVVVNVPNHGAIEDLAPEDVVEVPCRIDRSGARPIPQGRLPDSVRGLVQSVKAYERTAIRAAIEGSRALAQLALLECPIVGQWELAGRLLESLIQSDPEHLGFLR